jgi:hypothetical protein
VLALVGLLFTAGIYPVACTSGNDPVVPGSIRIHRRHDAEPLFHPRNSLVAGSANPSAHRSLIAFAAWSSLADATAKAITAYPERQRKRTSSRRGDSRGHRRAADRTGSSKTTNRAPFGALRGLHRPFGQLLKPRPDGPGFSSLDRFPEFTTSRAPFLGALGKGWEMQHREKAVRIS